METIITFFCIVGLCIFMYGYIRMTQMKSTTETCNILYIPEHDGSSNLLPHMEVLDHEEHNSKFNHTRRQRAPMGISEIEDLIPSSLV